MPSREILPRYAQVHWVKQYVVEYDLDRFRHIMKDFAIDSQLLVYALIISYLRRE